MKFSSIFSLAGFVANVFGFDYGVEKIRGVNIGGWLVLEPWITPSLFQQFEGKQNPAVDEWTFCEILGKGEAERQLRRHWDSWLNEGEIVKLAHSGINHIRIPVGYWAVDVKQNEPWVMGAFEYLEKGVMWAKNAGLKVMLDIHGAPGSQNGFDNSGKRDSVKFLDDPENTQRMIKVITHLTKHFSNQAFGNAVTSIQLVNEPAGWALDFNTLKKFYSEGFDAVKNNNNNFIVTIHDAFKPLTEWEYLNDERHKGTILDTHIYQVFDYSLVALDKDSHLALPCKRRDELAKSNSKMTTIVGEWSLATTDCTKWLNGFNRGARYDGKLDAGKGPACPTCTCDNKDELNSYTPDHHNFLRKLAQQQIGVYENSGSGWFFWNFKAEKSPEWDFMTAIDQGWITLNQTITPSC